MDITGEQGLAPRRRRQRRRIREPIFVSVRLGRGRATWALSEPSVVTLRPLALMFDDIQFPIRLKIPLTAFTPSENPNAKIIDNSNFVPRAPPALKALSYFT